MRQKCVVVLAVMDWKNGVRPGAGGAKLVEDFIIPMQCSQQVARGIFRRCREREIRIPVEAVLPEPQVGKVAELPVAEVGCFLLFGAEAVKAGGKRQITVEGPL